MEANEEQRDKYKEAIKNIPTKQLVYIDGSGIDVTLCKDRGWGKRSEKLVGVEFFELYSSNELYYIG